MDYFESYRFDRLKILCSTIGIFSYLFGQSVRVLAGPIEENFPYRYSFESTLSFPQPLMVGVEVEKPGYPEFRGYLDAGFFQYPIPIKKVGVKELTVEAGLRYRSSESHFFVSLGLGYRMVSGFADVSSLVVDGDSLATGANMKLHTLYFTPMVDYRIDLSQKIEISFGAGLQIPILVSSSMNFMNSNTGEDSSNSASLAVDSFPYLNRVAGLVIPRVTLFRFIWHLDP